MSFVKDLKLKVGHVYITNRYIRVWNSKFFEDACKTEEMPQSVFRGHKSYVKEQNFIFLVLGISKCINVAGNFYLVYKILCENKLYAMFLRDDESENKLFNLLELKKQDAKN